MSLGKIRPKACCVLLSRRDQARVTFIVIDTSRWWYKSCWKASETIIYFLCEVTRYSHRITIEELGAPQDILHNRASLTRLYHNSPITVWVLNISQIMASKLHMFKMRGFEKDFQDIIYLLDNKGKEIISIRSGLDTLDILHFCDSKEFAGLGVKEGDEYRKILVF